MDKDKVLPVLIGAYSKIAIAEFQRDADFAVLEQVAEAVAKIDRTRAYGGREVCTGCWAYEGKPHTDGCSWQRLGALGIVEKA